MKHTEKITPVAAAVSALSTIACCLPSGIAAAAGAAGLGVVVEPLRPWLVGLIDRASGSRIRTTLSLKSKLSAAQHGQHRCVLDLCNSGRRYPAVSSNQRWPARRCDSVARL